MGHAEPGSRGRRPQPGIRPTGARAAGVPQCPVGDTPQICKGRTGPLGGRAPHALWGGISAPDPTPLLEASP